ncbi:MAG: hypothetical protein AMS18_14460 [Gemmatimonas sp. SG8_17]|nr:MAG: hypothetical protein AMS18_14460 [Gemmatimonas sp. SG8_17]
MSSSIPAISPIPGTVRTEVPCFVDRLEPIPRVLLKKLLQRLPLSWDCTAEELNILCPDRDLPAQPVEIDADKELFAFVWRLPVPFSSEPPGVLRGACGLVHYKLPHTPVRLNYFGT